jgi:cell division protein FtsB
MVVISVFKKKLNGILWILPVILFSGLILLVINGYKELHQMRQLAQKREALIRDNLDLNRKNAEMIRKVTRLKQDPVYLEEVARSEFGLVKPDEIIFFIDNGIEKEASRNGSGTRQN